MNGEIHVNRVLYNNKNPKPGHKYRQIAVVEVEFVRFWVFTWEGDVIQSDPKFDANNPDAGGFFHTDLASALADAEMEYARSVEAGWIPYA